MRLFTLLSTLLSLPILGIMTACSDSPSAASDAAPLRVMLLTGQSSQYHDWTRSSPILRRFLEESGRFTVDVVLTPAQGEDMSGFAPDWDAWDVVVLDYEGDMWPETTRAAFESWMAAGGGLVTFHAADNAFPQWEAYNRMIGVGGWGGRDMAAGPMLRLRDGKWIRDYQTPGGATHPPKHDFLITVRAPDHPVMRELPEVFLHADDELYSRLRGPAENLEVLASGRAQEGLPNDTGEDEPVLMAIQYGEGRVYHTTLGHVGHKDPPDVKCLHCVGFITTFLRGVEWAASGEVTLPVPDDFPTAEATSVRQP
jgi:uncharacterized protein